MKSFLIWCKKEFIRMLPVSLFFLVAFSLVDATDRIVNKHSLTTYSFLSCVVDALIMGKIVLIADSLKLIKLCEHKPLVWVTLWKSFFYVICSMVLRLAEHSIPAIVQGQSLQQILMQVQEHVDRPLFWIAQCWLAYLFIIFVGYRELVMAIGTSRFKSLFFKK